MTTHTRKVEKKEPSLVFLHEVLLFAGAAVLLSVAYPRAELMTAEPVTAAPAEFAQPAVEARLNSPATTDNELTIIVADQGRPSTDVMQPAAVGSTELTDVKQLLVAPDVTAPLVADSAADPAS